VANSLAFQQKNIVIRLLGGLGNQLFQLTFGSLLANISNADLFLDSSLLCDHTHGRHLVNRSLKLSILANLYPEIDLHTRLRNNCFGCSWPVRGYSKMLRAFAPIRSIHESSLFDSVSSTSIFLQSHPSIASFCFFEGCWQYIQDYPQYDRLIKQTMLFNPSLLAAIHNASNTADIDYDCAVAVHVRRSDYLFEENQAHIVCLEPDYYQSANYKIQALLQSRDLNYFVFSDDLEWCRSNLAFLSDRVNFVEKPASLSIDSDVFDFLFMSLFKNYIIPNSTFSLWAAYLSRNRGKRIIAPSRWFHGHNGPPSIGVGYLDLI
jgi:hypothetical protein